MKNLQPHIIDWAIKRIDQDRHAAAHVAKIIVSERKRVSKNGERVLQADPVVIGTAILAVVGATAPTAVAFGIGAAVLIAPSLAVNFSEPGERR